MRYKEVITIFWLLLLGMGFLASSQSSPFTGTIKLVVPPALEVQLARGSLAFDLTPGSAAVAATELSVGTNDWPLELYASVLPSGSGSTLVFEYQLAVAQGSLPMPSWIKVQPFKLTPSIELTSPGWTKYKLSVRVTAQGDAASGSFFQSLHLILRSRSGLVEAMDIPVSVMVFSTGPPGSVQEDKMEDRGVSATKGASESGNAKSDTQLLAHDPVVIITWEGITQVGWSDLPVAN